MAVRVFKVMHRRRREQKTDYRKRLLLLKSNIPRAVVRRSLSHMSVQFIKYRPEGDITAAAAKSCELKKFGWTTGTGNLPAAYLTGLLAGKRGMAAGIKKAVLDIGMHASTPGSRIYAALKGLCDAGMEINHDSAMLPDEKRLSGEHIQVHRDVIKKEFNEVKEKILKMS